MRKVENVKAPNLAGWAIGAAAGLVAFGVLVVVGKFDLFPAAALSGAIAAVAGLILGMPWGSSSAQPAMPARKAVAAPAATTPKAEKVSAPAAFVAVPSGVPAPKAKPAAKPKAEAPAKAASKAAAKPKAPAGPERLKAARKGKADDLKEIEGIGPAMEKLVNSLGFYHFDQIAGWSDADVALVDAEMKTFKGRIARDRWVAQAKIIVTEGLDAFRERAKTNNY
ncbi:MAG: NADH:ubiquinone oxidoreductase [Rhodobacterales bacterium]|nr:NADH:ubiquinone oxidoreductase [Rhodobacterales bacterium]